MSVKSKYINNILQDCVKNINLIENGKDFYAYDSVDDYNKTLDVDLCDFTIPLKTSKI